MNKFKKLMTASFLCATGVVTILSPSYGPARAAEGGKIPVKIVLEAAGLTADMQFDISLHPFLRNRETGEPMLQPLTADRVTLGPGHSQVVETYSLEQGLQYYFTVDVPTATGDLPEYTYALAAADAFTTTTLMKESTVVLRVVKTPRNAENNGTLLDVSNLKGSWELAVYAGPALASVVQ